MANYYASNINMNTNDSNHSSTSDTHTHRICCVERPLININLYICLITEKQSVLRISPEVGAD